MGRGRKACLPDHLVGVFPSERIGHHIVVGAEVGGVQMKPVAGFNSCQHLKQKPSEGVSCLPSVDPLDHHLIEYIALMEVAAPSTESWG